MKTRILTTALVGLLLSVACTQGSVNKPAVSPASCEDYASKFCEVVGAESPDCSAAQNLFKLLPADACAQGMAGLDYTKTEYAKLRVNCDELVKKLCADIGTETQTCAMVTERTATFPPVQCEQMMGEYDKVLAELKMMEAANKPLDAAQRAEMEGGVVASFGPKDAAVTIVEFSDFECPYCSLAANVANQIKEAYAGKSVRFVFRHFPLSFHQNAHLASQASLAAMDQGKFWEFHDLLFENQKAMTRTDLEAHAEKLGLNMATFKKALDAGTYKAAVDKDLEIGSKVAVQGTPTMFINGARVQNPTDFATVSKQIDAGLTK